MNTKPNRNEWCLITENNKLKGVCANSKCLRVDIVFVTVLCVLGVVLSTLPFSHAATIEVYYGPEDRPGDKVTKLYDKAQEYVYVAMYAITYPPAIKSLVSAAKRGVEIRVMTDRDRLQDRKQRIAVKTLRLAGIPVHVNIHTGLMHLKQVMVDDQVKASGSMNMTVSGHRFNDERLDVIRDPVTKVKAREKFLAMWNDASRYESWN